jgi:outer membrane protein assembly factor BamA
MKKWIALAFLLAAGSCLQAEQSVLEKIVLFGNTRMREGTVIRQIGLKPLSGLNDSLLNLEKSWLIRLGFLERVDFLTKPGSTPDKRILMIVMREKSRFSTSPSLHSDYLFGWYGGFDVEYTNLRGTRERMDFSMLAGKYKKMQLSWQVPDLVPAWQLFFNAEIGWRDFPYLFPDFKPSFSFREDRLCFMLGKRFSRRLSAGTALGWESVHTGNREAGLSGRSREENRVLSAFFEWDSRDWPGYPKSGIYFRAEWELEDFADPFSMQSVNADFRIHQTLARSNILAFQSACVFSGGSIPVYKRLHLGGGETLRGYRTGAMSGENIWTTGLEYRFPIVYERNLPAGIHAGYAGVLFADAGTAWYNRDKWTFKKMRGSVGFGVHAIWDQWILRAEYGYHGRGWGFINTATGIKF